ncbi:MAG: acyltransferase, partial [Methylomonas lenta]|nr:acyltransferase [Methylomonas lenta]
MKKPIIACAVQQPCNRGRDNNLAYSISQIEQAARQNAELIVLPELHLDHYFCQSEDTDCFDLAQAIPGPACETLSQVAKDNKVVIVSTIFEKRAPGLYHNTAVVFDKDGSLAGTFRKM